VAATNKNLEELVKKGEFRQDLYYRINVVKLALPPLRERKEDIPLLVEHFIRKFNRLSGKEIKGLSPEVFPLLMSHDFPGNIRELENIIEYASVVCKNSLIGIEHLPEHLHPESSPGSAEGGGSRQENGFSMEDMERTMVYEALRKNNWNRKKTADQMGIHTTTLWRKVKRLNIQIPNQDGRSNGE
jgi:transcriptional regulator with PAS, ATPase and Fis domain